MFRVTLRALRRFGVLLAQTIDKCARDNTSFLAGSISFYSVLSLAPASWIVIAITGAIVGHRSARGAIVNWVAGNIGALGAKYIETIIDQVNESSRLATIGGTLAVFLGATAAFAAVQNSLALIWNLPNPPVVGFWPGLRDFTKNFFTTRVLGFVAMFISGLLLICSLFAGAVLSFVERYMPASLPAPHLLLDAAHFLISVILMMLMFATVYFLLHRESFASGEIWVGAALTAVLFAIGNAIISPYLGRSAPRSAYGAAGAFVLLLLWIYYSAQIFLFGAAFTEVYSRYCKLPPEQPPRDETWQQATDR
jgi:membrane protein